MFTFSPDVVVPPFISWFGLPTAVGVLVFVLTVGVEALVLKRLQWGTWRRVVVTALVMNLCSTLFGFFAAQTSIDFAAITLAIAFVLSLFIEWAVLHAFKPQGGLGNLRASFWANLASYIPLTVFVLFAIPRL